MKVSWEDSEQRVMRWVLAGELNWMELDRMMDRVAGMLDDAPGQVYVIVLAEQFRLPPDTPMHFPAMAQKRYWHHPKLAATIVIGADHFFKMMIDIYSQVYESIGAKITGAQSIDEAYQIIEDAQELGTN